MELQRRRELGAVVVVVNGELDVDTTPLLRAELTILRRSGERQVVIDLREATLMDSSAVGALWVSAARYQEAKADLVLRAPSPGIRQVIDLTGLGAVLPVEDG